MNEIKIDLENNGLIMDTYHDYTLPRELLIAIKQLQQENKVLKKTLENNSKINVADHKYASEMEDKYLVEHNILTEFEKWLEEEINIIENTYSQINGNYMRMQPVLDTFKKCEDRLQELKGGRK